MSTIQDDKIAETVDDALAAWDSGQRVVILKMGLNDDYEHAIWKLVFELLRSAKAMSSFCSEASVEACINSAVNRVSKELDAERVPGVEWIGFARVVAFGCLVHGYRKAIVMCGPDGSRRRWWSKNGRFEGQIYPTQGVA